VKNHEPGDLECPGCEEQFGYCSCGGVIHCEYQETFRRDPLTGEMKPGALLVLECDRCDECEVE